VTNHQTPVHMSKYSRLFAITSLLYLLLASFMGLTMAISPPMAGVLRFPHIHAMMIGWVSMMIFGLAYHVVPRFAGSPLIKDVWQGIHFWCANIALLGMILTPILQNALHIYTPSSFIIFAVFGSLQGIGILIFVFTMLRALKFKMPSKPCCNSCQ